MDCALREAETVTNQQINAWKDMLPTAQAVATLRAETYQDALKEAIKTCYKSPMNQAFRWLTAESQPYGLPKPQIETITSQDFMTLVMVIPLRCFDIEDYCPDGDDSGNNPKIEQPYDNIVSINLLIISFEWNTDTNELEFNVGQGVILGATWSPETGFGLQLGVGVDIGFGGVGIEAATYVTVDEGVTGLRTELGGSFGVGPIGFGAEIVPFQAVLQER